MSGRRLSELPAITNSDVCCLHCNTLNIIVVSSYENNIYPEMPGYICVYVKCISIWNIGNDWITTVQVHGINIAFVNVMNYFFRERVLSLLS